MLFTAQDIAKELAAQLPDTDLGVTSSLTMRSESNEESIVTRLDNGQEFLLTVAHWGGPKA